MKCVCEKSSGYVSAFTRWGRLTFDDTTQVLLDVDHAPDRTAEIWDGAAGLRLMTLGERQAYADLLKGIEADTLIDRAADATMLDLFWLILKTVAPVGAPAIDDAVATDDRAAFNQHFKNQVKSRL